LNSNIISVIRLKDGSSVRIARVSNRALGDQFQDVVRIEEASFPSSIRDSASQLLKLAESPLALFLLADVPPTNKIVGYLSAERLELFEDVPGIKQDPHFMLGDTVYLSSVAVLEPYRHQGIGMTMQRACLELAKERQTFKRLTLHVVKGSLTKMGLEGQVLSSFGNYYQTGKTYDYVEVPLKLGEIWQSAG